MLLFTVTSTSLRELGRRRVALISIFLLPLVFYVARIDQYWQALRFLSIGVGWSVATLSLFSYVDARRIDRRLAVIGGSPSALFLGRQLALLIVGAAVVLVYFVLVAATHPDLPRLWAVALLLATAVLISAPIGSLISIVIDRHLEGALALLPLMALQLLVDPNDSMAKLLPLWSTRELTAYVVDGGSADRIALPLLHFFAMFVLFLVAAWAASVARIKPVRLSVPQDDQPN